MEETENPDNSGDSDSENDEQKENEGDDSDDDQDADETPAGDASGDDQDENQDGSDLVDPDETETELPEEKVDEEEVEDDNEVLSSTPNALVPADLTITAVEPDTSDDAEEGATKALASADITYTNGCVSNGKIRKNADITFKLDAKAGKKLGTVQYQTKGTTADATWSAAANVEVDGTTYKIPKTALMHEVTGSDGTKTTINDVSVTIIVPTTDIAYTLKAGTNTGYTLNLTKQDNNKTVVDTTKEISTAGLADKVSYANKDTVISFAVVKGQDVTTKIRSVTAKAGDGEEKVLESEAKTEDTAEAPIYTFKPSDLADIADNDNQDITITVTADAVATITVSAPVSTPTGAVTFGTVDNADALYGENNAVNGNVATTANEGQKVVFTATADTTKYTALAAGDVTATFTPSGGEAASIAVSAVAESKKTVEGAEKTIPAHYVIDLATVTKAGTLAITAKTTLDKTKDGVATVDFSSVSENTVEVKKTGGSKNLAGTTETTETSAAYGFSAASKPGYEIYQVEVVYNKEYKGQGDGDADLETISGYKENLFVAENILLDENGAYVAQKGDLSSLSVAFSGTDAADVAEGQGYAGKQWTTKNVAVNVYSRMIAVKENKTITFTSEYDYEVKTGDAIVAAEEEDTYTVKPGAEIFEFTVDAVAEPKVVAADENDNSILMGKPNKTTNGYVYQIAAGALANAQAINITRDAFDIAVNYDKNNVSAEVYAADDLENALTAVEGDGTDTYSDLEADKTYKFIIEPANDNTKISKVSYTVGDSEEATAVTAKGGSYVFSVELTDDVNVTVETKNEYDLVVKENGAVVTPDRNSVYNVGHASTVTAELLKGEEQAAIFNADVKDGSAVAATIAKVADDVVTLEFDSTEYNKVLTVELTLNDKTRTKKSFKVKTTAAAAEVSITGVKGGKVDLPVDTKASYKLAVKTKNASLDGIGVKVVPADDAKKADAAAITAAANAVSAEITEGNLVITAKPAMTGTENAAKVIIVDQSGLTSEQIAALTVDNALKGGVVTVNTKDATIVGQNPTVSLVTTTDKTIKVKLGVPKGVVDPETGKIFYKVELTVPQSPTFPEGVSDAEKTAITAALTAAATDWNTNNLYQEKAKIDEKGGLLEIPVMKFTNAKDEGMLLEGFSVEATLLQTIAANGLPSAAETTIVGGKTPLENIATKNPYYEVKLGLKKGTTTLITGQDQDMVVATPNFNKLTSYSSVKVEFVNTSSGEVISTNLNTNGYDSLYRGMYAKYNALSNAVIVNAKDASYTNNANDNYKNLGVKVTAYAEDSAYGAVATQKLTVVNGIEVINPSAPLEIYKADKKPASFTVTTDLNNVSTNKKYAPKAKKLNYEIVGIDDGNGDEADLPAGIRANVTVAKNGKVTVNKNYIPAPKAAQNQFRVKVSAADYANSEVVAYTETITITDEGLKMGEIAVFDVATGKLVAAASGSIEATVDENEYQVAVLAPGVKTNKKTYNLNTDGTSADIINPALLTFKSSSAKSVSVDEEGALTVLKAAKNVKITAIPKDGSNPKPVKTLTVTVGQVATSPLLKISRYQGSTLRGAEVLHEGGATTINYNGNSTNNYFKLDIVKAVTKGDTTTYVPFYLANYSISYRGAKQIGKAVNNGTGDSLTIVANAADAVITLKDKTNRSASPVVYTLHNNDFVSDNNAKAPKIATTTKMTQNTWSDYVYYTVKGGKTDDFTDKYVMLSIDQTKKNPTDIANVFATEDDSYLDKPLPIVMGAGFHLYVDTWCASGNYNLVATVGSLENGVFKPEYKDAKVTVKIAKAKAANLSATGNYTLSLKANSGAYIKYKSGTDWAGFTNEPIDGNYAKNAIINGQENHFTDYFEVKYDRYDMYVALKDLPLTAPDNDKNAPALDKIADDANKNDRIGYISINNGSKYIDVKLTITIKDYTKDKTKYKVTATPVLDGPKAVTALTILEGKAKVDVAAMLAVSEAGFTPIFDRNGNSYLEAANLTAGSHKVDLYIVPWNAPKAYRDAIKAASGEAAKQEAYEKYGIKTSITVKASDKTTTKNKVAVVNKGSNKWIVADTDYNAPTGWEKYTPFSFKSKLSVAETTDIAIKASVNSKDVDYVSFYLPNTKYMSYETIQSQKCVVLPTNYPMYITLDKAKLTAAIAADAANNEIAARNKLDWGKTVNVKATFSYGANGPKEDELTFQIKLPDNAGAAEQAVKEALNAAEKKLQSDIETYTKALKDANRYYIDDDGNFYDEVIFEINDEVESYIRNEINKAIKGAAVTVEITNNSEQTSSGDDGDVTTVQIATEWTVVVKTTATGTAEWYNHKFVIPEKAGADSVVTTINNLSLGSNDGSDTTIKDGNKVLLKVTADTTAAEFAAAVRAKLGTAVTRNLSITASIEGTPKKPSTTEQGSISFKLTVKDLSKAPNETGYSASTETIEYVLAPLDDLDTCKGKITSGLNAAALTAIVKDAWKSAQADVAFEAKVKELVLAKANELIDNNPAITVDGFAKDTTDNTKDLFKVTKPTSGTAVNGKIEFTLHLKDTGTAETEANAANFKLTVNEMTLQAIEEFQTPTELLNAATSTAGTKIIEIDYVATEAAALAAIKAKVIALSKNPGYNTASIAVEATLNTAETGQDRNGTVFTAPGESNGSITKVIVKVGTGEDDKATIDSITIKKQATTE